MHLKIKNIARVFPFLISFIAMGNLQSQGLNKESQFVDHQFMPCYNLKKIGNTAIFQGNKKKNEYFEGWYFKMVSKDGSSIISVIPGISLSRDGSGQHAFIQLINGMTAQTRYVSFPIEDFSFSRKSFAVKIGDNIFSKDSIVLDIQDQGVHLSGKVYMANTVAYKSGRIFNPGIMGWYRFVPFMECYHGVLNLTHDLHGKLMLDDELFDFSNGKGYIEKDWGTSMPSVWVWMQSNHFSDTSSSLMLSIANIPWLGKSFTGFLGFYYLDGKIHHFATYRPSKLVLENAGTNSIRIRIDNRKCTFLIQARPNNSGMLKAPTKGSMDRRIAESIDAKIVITMLDKNGNTMHRDSTNIAGLEMVGDYKGLAGALK